MSIERKQYNWVSPLAAAAGFAEQEGDFILLYSGEQREHTGRYSYLALYPQETVSGDDFSLLEPKLSSNKAALENAWFGYFAYELGTALEQLPEETQHFIKLPRLTFTRYGVIFRFDHQEQTILCTHEASITPPTLNANNTDTKIPAVKSLTSPMRKTDYLKIIEETTEAIRRGDFYQANITRKFTGEFTNNLDAFSLFCKLCEASPAPYSAFMRIGDASILSSSPEQFLTISKKGFMQSRPIKGTAPRFVGSRQDAVSRAQLAMSEKDRAENLMIVDLMRNDLSRTAIPGSIAVDRLFEITSYATLHHMASTVGGQKHANKTALDALRSAFPPGSMTGAPKIRAMQWCLAHEHIQRGVYSGALGWFGGDGACDFSVVIRTLILQGNRFEFQVGGGIVADSEPEKEWQETMTKARGTMAALGLDMKMLERI